LAADQFIVRRTLSDEPDPSTGLRTGGRSVIAGYPWFGDWGRDTMISLPGLTLVTGRHDVAARILRTFAHFVDQGMLPNRFPDKGETPEYNTVDATLWYFEAIRAYHAATGDDALLRDRLCRIVALPGVTGDHRMAPARHALQHPRGSCRRSALRGRAGSTAHLDGRQGGSLGGDTAHRQVGRNQRIVV
jgi:hypothetical protein